MAQRRQHQQSTTKELFPGVSLPVLARDANLIVPTDYFTRQSWWEKLKPSEQNIVELEAQALARAMMVTGFGHLAQGQALANVQEVLEPHNVFGKFLRPFHFSVRTAYRYIRKFNNAKERLPENILKAAIGRGIPIAGDSDEKPLGSYTLAVKKLPPPKKPTIEEANEYLSELEKVRRETRAQQAVKAAKGELILPETDPDIAAREVVGLALNRYKKLHTGRTKWAREVLGMLAKAFNIEDVEPLEIPEGFIRPRGAPRKNKVAVA